MVSRLAGDGGLLRVTGLRRASLMHGQGFGHEDLSAPWSGAWSASEGKGGAGGAWTTSRAAQAAHGAPDLVDGGLPSDVVGSLVLAADHRPLGRGEGDDFVGSGEEAKVVEGWEARVQALDRPLTLRLFPWSEILHTHTGTHGHTHTYGRIHLSL